MLNVVTSTSPWMQRALQLARLGAGRVAPNPMVGAVLVEGDRILAEGWHQQLGGPHAERECLNDLGDHAVPPDAVMLVSLEPCSHHGKTPPCADLLIARGVKKVVIAHGDPNPLVSGKGIARLRAAGVEVITGECETEARWLNRRFLHFHEQGRPWVVLKWARSADGFMDRHPRSLREVQRITTADTDVLVHRWRSQEQAIVVGGRTVLNDDPHLTVRHVEGRQPLRVVLDTHGDLPVRSNVFDGSTPTLLVTPLTRSIAGVDELLVAEGQDLIGMMMKELVQRRILSVMVEGGATVLRQFIERGWWNEARVISGAAVFNNGTMAPSLPCACVRTYAHGPERVDLYANAPDPDPAWPW